jgi:2,4-dienoyl-CoA reductase-like NADH-dependent reductase (Old Yellow Enzyme family)
VLFEPLDVAGVSLRNRIVIAPMCQYSAVDGNMTDWHLIHLGQLALSGAALLTIEATAVLPEGRISYADVGLWNDDNEAAMRGILDSIRRWSDIPIAIQLAHAGRKASTDLPWNGGAQIAPEHQHGWQTEAPSAVPFADGDHAPVALDRAGLGRIRDAFAASAVRAARLASMRCRSTQPTATCSTSFYRLCPITGKTNTVAAWRTACGFRSRCTTPFVPHFLQSGR